MASCFPLNCLRLREILGEVTVVPECALPATNCPVVIARGAVPEYRLHRFIKAQEEELCTQAMPRTASAAYRRGFIEEGCLRNDFRPKLCEYARPARKVRRKDARRIQKML